METVRYGIIGVGNIGSTHIANIMAEGNVPNAQIVAIADLKPEKIKLIQEKYPQTEFAVYASGEELIDNGDVDAVIVCVPHYQHPELCIRALNKGLHVICEKPAGVYTKQVKEMVEVAKTAKGLFTMMFNQRTNCLYRKMRELIADGEIGTIRRINWIITDWYRSQCYYDSGDWRATWAGEGGGVLFNQCPHQLDLLQWITGMMPSKVHAFCHYGKWHDIEVEDDVTAYLEYENGATGVFVTSTADAPGTNRFEVQGTGGKLVAENGQLLFIKNEIDEREFNRTSTTSFGRPAQKTVPVETDGSNLQHTGICRNFTNAILGKEPLMVDGKEGINGVILMDAMMLSGWLGKTVELPFDDDLYLEILQEKIKNSKVKKTGVDIVSNTEGTYNSL